MAAVLLKINGKEESVAVSKLKVWQLTSALAKIKHVTNIVRQNPQLADALDYLSSIQPVEGEDVDLNREFLDVVIKSFDFLLGEFPKEAIELISVLSGIEVDDLNEQEIETLFDVFDAIVKENDLLMLWNRAKQSFSAAKSKWKVIKQQ